MSPALLRRHTAALALLAFLVIFPGISSEFWTYQIGAQSLVLGAIALSLVFLAGYVGRVSLAQLTIAGVASYATAYFGINGVGVGLELPWPFTVLVALAVGTLVATLIGAVSVRTQGIYTIMITLAIAVGFSYLARQNYDLFNGFTGFNGVVPPTILGIDLGDPDVFYYLCLAYAVLAYLVVLYVVRTPFGLALQGIRDNPRRMSALGFKIERHMIAAFAFSGVIASGAGVLNIWYFKRISPDSIGPGPILNVLIVAVVGGLGHPIGAFVGAVLFVLLETFAIDLIDRERFRLLIGLILLAIVVASPDGLVGLWRRGAGGRPRSGLSLSELLSGRRNRPTGDGRKAPAE